MNKDVSILVLSCDKYEDLWNPFFKLLKKYWKIVSPSNLYISTESKQCDSVNTICVNEEMWTTRIRKSLEQIKTKYVIIMCDDFFLRKPVRQDVINKCVKYMNADSDIASFNFEMDYTNDLIECDYLEFGQKKEYSGYKHSCQASLWNREILIKELEQNQTPWAWELSPASDDYKYYVYNGDENNLVFEYGYHDSQWMGVKSGKWIGEDVIPLFAKEDIVVDYTKRGFYDLRTKEEWEEVNNVQ